MQQAREQGITTVFAPLRAPYIASEFAPVSDIILATFGYNVDTTSQDTAQGAVFEALAAGVFTDFDFRGRSPVSVMLPSAK